MAGNRPAVDQERLWNHERVLCEEIGARLSGTPEDEETVKYAVAHFERCGAEVEVQDWPTPCWEHESTELTLVTEAGAEQIFAVAQTFSESCDVEAELVPVSTFDEMEKAPDLEGKILVLHGRLATSLAGDRNRNLMSAEDRKPAALVLVSSTEPVPTKMIRDPYARVPSAAVPNSAGAKLLQNAGARLRLRIKARRYQSTGHNVIARFPGDGKGVLCVPAHYDTAALCPSATDNASGTAIVLELCELFSKVDRRGLGMNFIVYGGEEYGRHGGACNLGAVEYVRRHPDEVKKTLAIIEPDCGGTAKLPPMVRVMAWPAGLKEGILDVLRRFPRYQADVRPDDEPPRTAFDVINVPGLWFVNDYGKLPIHCAEDTMDLMTPEELAYTAEAIANVLDYLLEAMSR
jgi:aminopeptidase YwaD